MNSLQLFVTSIIHPQHLNRAKKNPFWKVLFYIFFLLIILSLPIVFSTLTIFNEFKTDGTEIMKKIPEFSISDGQFNVPSKQGFVYQSNTLIFTFDPEGKRSVKDLERDPIDNQISLGFLKDQFVFVLPENSLTTTLFETNVLKISYSNSFFKNMTQQSLQKQFSHYQKDYLYPVLIILFLAYSILISLVINLLIISICANLYSKLRFVKLSLMENFKIVVYSATLPLIVTTLISILPIGFPSDAVSTLFILLTLFVYSRALKSEPRLDQKL